MGIKPGYKTSEFWFTLVSFIFSGLFLLGFIGDNNQKEELIRDVSHGVESIILIGGQILILWNYINSRKVAKNHHKPVEKIVEEPKTNEPKSRRNTNKSRSNKNRSRKTNSKNQRKPK
jgi:hypothetical protein